MKVKELIEKLQQYDSDLEVSMLVECGYVWSEITNISYSEKYNSVVLEE